MPFSICFNVGLIPLQHFWHPHSMAWLTSLEGQYPHALIGASIRQRCDLIGASDILQIFVVPQCDDLIAASDILQIFFYSIPHSPFINIPFNLLTTDWLKQAVNEDEKKWVEWAILTLQGWPHHFRIPAFCFPRWYVISSRTMLISSLTPALVCVPGYKLLVYMYDKLSNNVHTTNYPLAWRFCRRFILWICDFLCHSRTNFFSRH